MSLQPFDLEPPTRVLLPRPSPLLDRGPRVRPRYVPGPLAEGEARVVLTSAGYEEPADFEPYDTYPTLVEPYRVFDLPAGQVARWQAAKDAFDAMQEEVEALISARSQSAHERITGL